MLPEVTRRVRPPRALAVPYPLGYPLGVPAAPGVQLSVLRALISLCARDDVPLLDDFDPNGDTGSEIRVRDRRLSGGRRRQSNRNGGVRRL
jgi:hypothetical protein